MSTYNVIKDHAKQLFIQLLYFGTFESWCIDHNIENKIYIKKENPEFKPKLRESCNKYYNKVKDNIQFKQKVSAQKNNIISENNLNHYYLELIYKNI